MSDSERQFLKQTLRSLHEQTLDERIERYVSVKQQWVTASHHFAHASSEAIDLYRDGYYTSCIMVTQAVNEGIMRFVADRNGVSQLPGEEKHDLARRMQKAGIISQTLLDAFVRIQRSYRNDFHHMNPPIANVDLPLLAKRNVTDLAIVEREIFACDPGPCGTFVPRNPIYWDIGPDGSVPAFVRLI